MTGNATPTKDEAEAAKAEAEAAQIRLQNEERQTDLAKAQREAEQRAAIAKSNKEANEAEEQDLTKYIPDLSKVDRGETTFTGAEMVSASGLALEALETAAVDVAKAVKAKIDSNRVSVLVTSDPDLASTDALYLEVVEAIDELTEAARSLVAELKEEPADGDVVYLLPAGLALGAASALASAIPSVLSLLSSKRSISTQPIAGDDVVAGMRVAAALAEADRDGTVRHDDFRVLTAGALAQKRKDLLRLRDELIGHLLDLPDAPAEGAVTAQQQVKTKITRELVAAIDGYLANVQKVAEGAKRSAWTLAVMREALRDTIRHVLLVKASAGSAQQLLNDRPLWSEDRFSTMASMGISWLLVRTSDGNVLGGGIETACLSVSGRIGDTFTLGQVQRAG